MNIKTISLCAAAILMTACQAPQLEKNADGVVQWDNSLSFKEVPVEQMARGEQICARLGKEAVGYHPEAKDLEGKVFSGGGFNCQETERSRKMQHHSNDVADAQTILASGGDLSMEMNATAAGNDGYVIVDGVVYDVNMH